MPINWGGPITLLYIIICDRSTLSGDGTGALD